MTTEQPQRAVVVTFTPDGTLQMTRQGATIADLYAAAHFLRWYCDRELSLEAMRAAGGLVIPQGPVPLP